jgi:hypothetical protein
MERKMSSDAIRLGRALALGWRENHNFDQYLKRTRFNEASAFLGGDTEAFGKVHLRVVCDFVDPPA